MCICIYIYIYIYNFSGVFSRSRAPSEVLGITLSPAQVKRATELAKDRRPHMIYVYVYIYIYIHTHIHMYIYIYMYTYIHTYIHIIYIYIYTHTCTYMYKQVHLRRNQSSACAVWAGSEAAMCGNDKLHDRAFERRNRL